jgi:single-stranded DNA-binding protein
MYNRVELIGWVGRPPEVQEHVGEQAKLLVTTSLATKRKWRDLDGVQHEITTWHTLEAWEGPAFILRNVAPGDLLFVEGYIHNETHEGKFHSAVVAQKVLRLKTKESGRARDRGNLRAFVSALDDHDREVLRHLLAGGGA